MAALEECKPLTLDEIRAIPLYPKAWKPMYPRYVQSVLKTPGISTFTHTELWNYMASEFWYRPTVNTFAPIVNTLLSVDDLLLLFSRCNPSSLWWNYPLQSMEHFCTLLATFPDVWNFCFRDPEYFLSYLHIGSTSESFMNDRMHIDMYNPNYQRFHNYRTELYTAILADTYKKVQRYVAQRTKLIKEDLMAAAWHPRRLIWCLDIEEARDLGFYDEVGAEKI